MPQACLHSHSNTDFTYLLSVYAKTVAVVENTQLISPGIFLEAGTAPCGQSEQELSRLHEVGLIRSREPSWRQSRAHLYPLLPVATSMPDIL